MLSIRFMSLVFVIFFKQSCCTIVRQASQLEIRSYEEIFDGFSYRNLTASSMEDCLQHCLSDCLCQSFQICGNSCQLCSTKATLLPTAKRRESNSCKRFEFKHRETQFVSAKGLCGYYAVIPYCLYLVFILLVI